MHGSPPNLRLTQKLLPRNPTFELALLQLSERRPGQVVVYSGVNALVLQLGRNLVRAQ